MNTPKPILLDKSTWKGRLYFSELYEAESVPKLAPITQLQAICFDESANIILYKHIGGWNGLPGGHLENGEDLEATLKREILEEIAAELEAWEVIGYEKVWYQNTPENISYFLRCWAKVKLLDQEVNDPAGKSLGRLVTKSTDAAEKLGYGAKGDVWIKLATERFWTCKNTAR